MYNEPYWKSDALPLEARAMLRGALSASAIGSPATVRAKVEAFAERTGADELMIASQIFDFRARVRSYEILAECFAGERLAAAA